MPIQTTTSIPCSFEAGTTTIFTHSNPEFPSATWACYLIISRYGEAPKKIEGVVSGGLFSFTLSSILTAGWIAGIYDYGFYFTKDSERGSGERGKITVLDGLTTLQAKTHAQQMVETLEKAMLLLGATTDASVSFNGQSFTQASIGTYRQDLVFWKAAVIREQQRQAALRGTQDSGFVQVQFQ